MSCMYLRFVISVKCEYPINQIEDSVRVTGFMDPAIEGTNINFSCSTGMIISGPKNSICTRNGEWKPAPNTVECMGRLTNHATILELVFYAW